MADVSFEKALEKLEKIVEALESGDITLEDALLRYEEGIKLSRLCQEKLATAEKKIEILTRTAKGELKREPFDAADDAESKSSRSRSGRRTGSAKEDAESDKDLLL